MAAGSFLLGLSQGIQQADESRFQRQRMAAQQRAQDAQLQQMEQNMQMRRQEHEANMQQAQFAQMTQLAGIISKGGLPATVMAPIYDRYATLVNGGMMKAGGQQPGEIAMIPPVDKEVIEQDPSGNPWAKFAKASAKIHSRKDLDELDKFTALRALAKEFQLDPKSLPSVQRYQQAQNAKNQEDANFLINNYQNTQDPRYAEAAARLKSAPGGMELFAKVSTEINKRIESDRVAKREQQEAQRKEALGREKEERVHQRGLAKEIRQDERARERAVIAAQSRVEASRLAEQEKSDNESISEYEARKSTSVSSLTGRTKSN